jgi:DMSO/TMAO reductase YedYZ molybdopterin-dependent catalytic subunit
MIRLRHLVPVAALLLLAGPGARAATVPVLELAGPAGTKSFTLAGLKQLRPAAGLAGTLNSAGRIVKPTRYRGVALADVLAAAGGAAAAGDVVVTAKDGYRITYTRAQVAKGDFAAFDPATGDTLAEHEPLFLLLAWEHEGRPLGAADDGPLRVVVACAKGGALVDAHLSVKNATKVELVAASGPWTLVMEGARRETMDQATFESGAAPGCHGVTWKDARGRAWTGIPLWLMVGRVDDARQHGSGAFADDLAAGTTVELTGAGGKRVSLAGERVSRNDGILLVHRLDGAPLAADAFPLRLAGPDVREGEELGGIVQLAIRPRGAGEGSGPAR